MRKNRFGLTRNIPEDVKRLVRQNCKFGCILCRSGIITYEHIDPTFANAEVHDPDKICCLCAGCHDSVTRGFLSKQKVADVYREIRSSDPGLVLNPKGVFDLSSPNARLTVGGMKFSTLIRRVIVYKDREIFTINPGIFKKEASVNAVFTDSGGRESFKIEGNEWFGDSSNWDMKTTGSKISVQEKLREKSLLLRFNSPENLIIEILNMRLGDFRLLVSKNGVLIGKHITDSDCIWLGVKMDITFSSFYSSVFEFMEPSILMNEIEKNGHSGVFMTSPCGRLFFGSPFGCSIPSYGLRIGHGCDFKLYSFGGGRGNVDVARRALSKSFEFAMKYISEKK